MSNNHQAWENIQLPKDSRTPDVSILLRGRLLPLCRYFFYSIVLLGLSALPTAAQSGHSAVLTCAQPTQPAGETIASTQIIRDGATIASIPPTPCAYTDTSVNAGETHTYSLTNTDTNAVVSVPTVPITVVIPGSVTPPPTTCSGSNFFGAGAGPTSTYGNDPQQVNLGIHVSAKVPWTINCIRLFRATDSSGNVPAATTSWTIYNASTKAALATGTFATQAPGWITAPLATPINIAANTSVIVAVNTSRYAFTASYFTAAKTDPTGTITAPLNAGLYLYGTSNAMPTTAYQSGNYWVDFYFTAGALPPSITISPASATVIEGGTVQFTATEANTTVPIVWSSNAPNGLFTAGATPGTATVTATAGTASASAIVTITAPPQSMATTCAWLADGVTWDCQTKTVNVPSGQTIKSVVTSGTLTNTTNGAHP